MQQDNVRPNEVLPDELDAVVVGAGFAGLYMLYKLRKLGLSAKVIEAGGDVGGTWYWNRYPGARCDVPSMLYSYSFDPELEQEWEWTEKYPSQPEILAYIHHVADRYHLRSDVILDTKVTSAHFDEGAGRWTVKTDRGHTSSARYCIMAVGCLSKPKTPDLPGISNFGGPVYHTAEWPAEDVDFSGQRVGVIGTGSSGIQVVPLLAERAAELTVFQRTPNFSLPAFNRPLDPESVAETKANYRTIREAARRSIAGQVIEMPTKSALEVSAEEREDTYTERWSEGLVSRFLSSYTDLMTDAEANETAAEFVRGRIREVVKDPEVAEALTPRGYPFAAKRPCLDTGYYDTFNRDNVRLVDLNKSPLVGITQPGVRTTDDEYELDSLVLATGFDAMTGALLDIDIRGRSDLRLGDKWADGPMTYLGMATAGFPNLFMIVGPGSPSVLSNVVLNIEQNVEWISDLLEHLETTDLGIAEPTAAAEQAWADHVREVADGTLYPQADSWYLGANVPGKPRVFLAYAGGQGRYGRRCDKVAANGYDGFTLGRQHCMEGESR